MPFPKSYEAILQPIHHYQSLSPIHKEKIHLLILLFINQKEFIGAKMTITDKVKVIISFYASLMRLGFKLGEKDHVSTVIVYPEHFIVDESQTINGIHRHNASVLEGQYSHGTVIISWQDIEQDITARGKENVIIHEFAHELDFEDGIADGTPLLEDSNYQRWSDAFSRAFTTLKDIEDIEDIDMISEELMFLGHYALTNEAEFFAVCSERFFEKPYTLKTYFPHVYEELNRFYRLDTEKLFS